MTSWFRHDRNPDISDDRDLFVDVRIIQEVTASLDAGLRWTFIHTSPRGKAFSIIRVMLTDEERFSLYAMIDAAEALLDDVRRLQKLRAELTCLLELGQSLADDVVATLQLLETADIHPSIWQGLKDSLAAWDAYASCKAATRDANE